MPEASIGAQVIADIQADVGDASASALGSLYGILGNPAQTLSAMLGHIVSDPKARTSQVDCVVIADARINCESLVSPKGTIAAHAKVAGII